MSWWRKLAASRPADERIPWEGDDPYMLRWFIRKRGSFNIYLHRFIRSDNDRHMHDHPWPSISVVLEGWYVEQSPCMTEDRLDQEFPFLDLRMVAPTIAKEPRRAQVRTPGSIVFRRAMSAHCILIPEHMSGEVYSLFITGKNRGNGWGFYTEHGYIPQPEYDAYLECQLPIVMKCKHSVPTDELCLECLDVPSDNPDDEAASYYESAEHDAGLSR